MQSHARLLVHRFGQLGYTVPRSLAARPGRGFTRSGAEMDVFGGKTTPICPSSRHCAEWARVYLKYCLCSQKDGAALALGLVSVISWGIAEVPQIITSYRQKSTEGLSIAFLMTWMVGDLFNLVGCFLEPATLPTQLYMAWLYTITNLILTGQTIYYGHNYHRLKAKKSRATSKPQKQLCGDASLREKLLGAEGGGASRNNVSDVTVPIPSSPVPVNTKFVEQYQGSSPNADYYYMSARSLSRSPVPTAGTWLGNNLQSSRTQTNDQRGSLIDEIVPAHSAPSTITKNALSVVPWMALLLAMCVLHILVGNTGREMPSGTIIPVGRRLLLFADDHGSGSEIGSFLGWAMAIIYMGGRLPQIFLNGLNPLMFTFALVGNSTYVGRVEFEFEEWDEEAAGDSLMIILQFLYFHYRKQREPSDEHDNTNKGNPYAITGSHSLCLSIKFCKGEAYMHIQLLILLYLSSDLKLNLHLALGF
ncbi:hypothetical protein U9M48_020234 [Paspalum notatum var. saurae]|uniref:PQ-loop repeat family protein / transmembrane family protein n=1 Tax=Paspalum notatum var. saurae TaxID=547442 RepID=A0AAQ3WSE0_PASNO